MNLSKFLSICDNVEKKKIIYQSWIDTGDGDHGVTMSIGWNAVKEKNYNP